MTRSEIAARELLKESKKATLLDVIKYKTVWLLKVIFGAYMKYVELYDFDGLIWGGRCRMGVVKGSFIACESLFKNHKYVVALNTTSEKYQAYVVLNPEDDINQVSMTPEMSYFIDGWSYGIISFKTDDARCNNSTYYENKCQDIITQLTAKIN